MTLIFSGFLLTLFGLSLILITLSLRLLRGTTPAGESYSSTAQFFLVALRLAIGWHCFVEGMEKLHTPNFSETYLRESVGPMSGVFRWMAGDRLIERVTLGSGDSFPDRLDREWQDYFNAFSAYYELDAPQIEQAKTILEQRKSDTLRSLRSKSEMVAKSPAFGLPLDKPMLEEHERRLDRVHAVEAKLPSMDKGVHRELKKAKDDLKDWRDKIKEAIDAQTDKLKINMDKKVKDELTKNIEKIASQLKKTDNPKEKAKLQEKLDEESAKMWTPLSDVLNSDQRLKDPMPEPKSLPVMSWRFLELSDFLVRFGLLTLGGCLMLGVLSRSTCFVTAILLFSFYIAMVPMPGWPESPKAEGHYMLTNKTLIEVIALMALAFIPTGRWAGLDGLLGLCCCGKAKAPPSPKP